MLLSVVQESNSQSRLISLSGSAIIKVNLSHASWSNWHDDLSQKLRVILSWKN